MNSHRKSLSQNNNNNTNIILFLCKEKKINMVFKALHAVVLN